MVLHVGYLGKVCQVACLLPKRLSTGHVVYNYNVATEFTFVLMESLRQSQEEGQGNQRYCFAKLAKE